MSPRRTHSSRLPAPFFRPNRQRPTGARNDAVRPRKELGQHFLVDANVLERIAAEAELEPNQSVLEVGAGTGELTAALAAVGARIAAVELDETLCRGLRSRFDSNPAVRVVNANILDHEPHELLFEAGLTPPYVVVANIPYYITAPILRHLLEAHTPPRRLVLTLQREVAESIAAPPGAFSLLAISVQFYATAMLLFRLPATAFRPPPKVESAVLRIDVSASPHIQVEDRDAFFEIVRAGFRSPRKQLHNALSRGIWMPPGEAEPLLRGAGIDPLRRAQTLSLNEWKAIYDAYRARRIGWGAIAEAPTSPDDVAIGPHPSGEDE